MSHHQMGPHQLNCSRNSVSDINSNLLTESALKITHRSLHRHLTAPSEPSSVAMETDYILIFNMSEFKNTIPLLRPPPPPRLSTAPPTANSSSGHPILPEMERHFSLPARLAPFLFCSGWSCRQDLPSGNEEFRSKQQWYNDRRHVSESFTTQRSTVDITVRNVWANILRNKRNPASRLL